VAASVGTAVATVKAVEGAGDLNRAKKLAEAAARGRAAEARVLKEMGLPKNHLKVVGREGEAIPDFITPGAIGEIKDRKVVANTRQLRIERDAARDSGKSHIVITGEKTKVTAGVMRRSEVQRWPDLGPQ